MNTIDSVDPIAQAEREKQHRDRERRIFAAKEGFTEIFLRDVSGKELARYYSVVLPNRGDYVTIIPREPDKHNPSPAVEERFYIESVANFIVDKNGWVPMIGYPLSHVLYTARRSE